MFPGIFPGEDIFIISLLSVARGGTAHPFAKVERFFDILSAFHTKAVLACRPAALQAAECLTPQVPERLLCAARTFCVIILFVTDIFRGLALPILLQAQRDILVSFASRLRPVSSGVQWIYSILNFCIIK